jgi:hypothetical protein
MSLDKVLASVVLVLLFIVIWTKQFSLGLLELMLAAGRPASTVVLLGLLVYMYSKNMIYTMLACVIVFVYLLKDLWVEYPQSNLRRLMLDINRDQSRFDPTYSIDLQFGNGTAKFDPPSMFHKDEMPILLIYPPTEDVRRDMNGS